jgi:hypothetical protein
MIATAKAQSAKNDDPLEQPGGLKVLHGNRFFIRLCRIK